MKISLLVTTAVGLLISAAASAQSPNDPSSSPSQAPAATAPASTQAPAPAGPADTAPPAQTSSGSGSPVSQKAQTGPRPNDAAPASNVTAPAAITQPANSSSSGSNSAAPNSAASQNAPSNSGTTTPANAQQKADAPASNTTNVNASINLNTQQQTRISDTLSRTRVQPLTNVNFSVSVGTVVPRNVSLLTVPADVVDIVPQYRGYSYVVVKDEIVIIDPSSYRIVTVLPRSGTSAAAPAKRPTFSDRDRDAVRKYSKTTTERKTVGSSSSVQVRKGERLPTSVEIEEFPETVYRDAPVLKEYRYIRRDSRTYVVDPAERVVIEEID